MTESFCPWVRPPWWLIGKESLSQEDPLEKELATHSSIIAWKVPWTEEIGGLKSMGSQRVGHNLVTKQKHKVDNPVVLVFRCTAK